MEPQYVIVHAVLAGAMGRVNWLLNQGADPFVKGAFGSAAEYAFFWGEELEKSSKRDLQRGMKDTYSHHPLPLAHNLLFNGLAPSRNNKFSCDEQPSFC